MEHILFKTKHTEWNLLHLKKKKGTQADNDGWANISKENEKKKKAVRLLGHISELLLFKKENRILLIPRKAVNEQPPNLALQSSSLSCIQHLYLFASSIPVTRGVSYSPNTPFSGSFAPILATQIVFQSQQYSIFIPRILIKS